MCNCCRNSTATLWAVSPVSAHSGCGVYNSQSSNTSACACNGYTQTSSCGYGCFGRCSSASTACQTAYTARQVNGCSNCPYASRCACSGCARNWCGIN